jgi:hypothetical protein
MDKKDREQEKADRLVELQQIKEDAARVSEEYKAAADALRNSRDLTDNKGHKNK